MFNCTTQAHIIVSVTYCNISNMLHLCHGCVNVNRHCELHKYLDIVECFESIINLLSIGSKKNTYCSAFDREQL